MNVTRVLKAKKFWFIGIPLLTLFLLVETSPLIAQKPPITGQVAKTARDNAKALADGLASSRSFIDLVFTEQDVVAISAATSHLFDNTNVALGYNPSFVQMGASTSLNLGLGSVYINTSCEIALSNTHSYLDYCRLGDLPVPGWMVKPFINLGVWLIFDGEVKRSFNNMLAGLRYEDRNLVLSANKSADLRQRVSQSLSNAASVAKVAMTNDTPPPDLINIYLDVLYQTDFNGQSLLVPMQQLAQLASVRSLDNSATQENAAMIWALAIRFGSQRFARLANVEDAQTDLGVNIRKRDDLALHFLYSAILQQVGNENLSFNIGELKEVLDSGAGGSGFSFVDLMADKTGIAFAAHLTSSNANAIDAQQRLANAQSERDFYPFSHDLPEGFTESQFARVFGDVNSLQYQALESLIDARINMVALYSPEQELDAPNFPDVATISNGTWHKVDTHIHTKYSDGNQSIDAIAKQAASYGCEAIAITDHGDRNLSGVLSQAYFADVAAANRRYNNMTVIPGFEWNIPPFNGREHATVLFANENGSNSALARFRKQFDHYNEKAARHLSIEPALSWLNEYVQSAETPPVVIYNHPSRKDSSVDENLFDLSNWMRISDTVIGLSGAPGHQGKRGEDNGSYTNYLRTAHGWDPVASEIGGIWDELLSKGYRVLGARADSDFHNIKMDYWPCQFSSTHVFSRSNRTNDILEALRAGNTWAQHGNFIRSLEFFVSTNEGNTRPGAKLIVDDTVSATINIDIQLNPTDWQGFATSLDELNLVIIEDRNIRAVPLLSQVQNNNGKMSIRLPFDIGSNVRAFRLQGRSIQPGLHHYQFMSNPIFFTEK
ncbi:PHP domain-containing protein [Glaciecola sp. SC05]|uniref:PHP domain-containing protein n=1 Tax=Glaciecola sp. SC05 TaxID=1987355 RepID=UPI003529A4D1